MIHSKTQIFLSLWMIFVFVLGVNCKVKAQPLLYPQNALLAHFDSNNAITLTYENDFPNKTDEYYTQGISLNYSYVKQYLKLKTPLQHSIAITHVGYTPQDISDSTLRYRDRPYAAALYLQASLYNIDNSVRHYNFAFSFYLGILGPIAGGEWMQRTIHKAIGSAKPQGWRYQIQNSVVIGPEAGISKKVWQASHYFRADAMASGRLTTLKTQLSAGVSLWAGLLPNNSNRNSKSVWVQYTGMVNAVAYDATLQGDLFSNNSPYTISNKDISSLVFYNTLGINIWLGRLRFQAQVSQLTKEFKSGTEHTYSGLTVGYRL